MAVTEIRQLIYPEISIISKMWFKYLFPIESEEHRALFSNAFIHDFFKPYADTYAISVPTGFQRRCSTIEKPASNHNK